MILDDYISSDDESLTSNKQSLYIEKCSSEVRRSFTTKVFSILSAQLILTLLASAFPYVYEPYKIYLGREPVESLFMFFGAVVFAVILGIVSWQTAIDRSFPMNCVFLILYTAAYSVIIQAVVFGAASDCSREVLLALLCPSIIINTALGIISATSSIDFTTFYKKTLIVLMTSTFIVLISFILTFKNTSCQLLFIGAGGISVLYSIYVISVYEKIMEGDLYRPFKLNEYVSAAVEMYNCVVLMVVDLGQLLILALEYA